MLDSCMRHKMNNISKGRPIEKKKVQKPEDEMKNMYICYS